MNNAKTLGEGNNKVKEKKNTNSKNIQNEKK